MSANIVKIFNSIIVYCANNCSPLNPETNIHNLQKKEVNTRGEEVLMLNSLTVNIISNIQEGKISHNNFISIA